MQKILYILPLLILFSCSVQKRKYQKGFYVSNNKHAKTKSTSLNKENKKNELALKTSILHFNSEKDAELTASINNNTSFLERKPINLYSRINDSLCDKITLKNGDEIYVNVLELTPALIKYKKCNEPESPLYIVKKTEVFSIKYSNGTKELMETETKSQSNTKNPNTVTNSRNYKQQTHPLAIWSLVSFILGFFTLGIGFIVAFILAKQAMKKILQNPEAYKGYKLANWVKIACIRVFFVLITLILISLIVP